MSKDIGFSVIAGLLSAFLFLSATTSAVSALVLSYLSPLPIMMIGLGVGISGLIIAAFVSAVAVSVLTGGFTAAMFLLAVPVPAFLIASLALRRRQSIDDSVEWYPSGAILTWLTLAAVIMLGIGASLLPTEEYGGIEVSVKGLLERGLTGMAPDLSSLQSAAIVEMWHPLFPALTGISWLMMVSLNAIGAQALVARLGRALRPTPAWRAIELPNWLAVAFLVNLVLSFVLEGDAGYLASNLAAVLSAPLGLLGLTVIHDWAATKKGAKTAILVLFYVVFALAFGLVAIAIVGLGLSRQWARLKRRAAVGSGKEN